MGRFPASHELEQVFDLRASDKGRPAILFAFVLAFATVVHSSAAWENDATPESSTISGRMLEACSCLVPCPCNFRQPPHPHSICHSVAIFRFDAGEIDGVALAGLHFAIAGRGGANAALFLDPALTEHHWRAIERLARWLLSFEGTKLIHVLVAPIRLNFGATSSDGSVGTLGSLKVELIKGNDGVSPVSVSRPVIFGSFPVIYSKKGVARRLQLQKPGLSFEYVGTNANDAVFRLKSSDVQ